MKAEWTKMRLDECTEIVAGATPSTSVDSHWGGDICWATPKDLSELDGAYIADTPRKLTRAGLESCAASVLPAGSVLFSSRAPIGHVAVNTVPMATNQGFKSFVPKPERVFAKFLYWWLRTNRAYLEGLGNGATFKEVSKAIVSRIEIPLPPLAEDNEMLRVRSEEYEDLLAKLLHGVGNIASPDSIPSHIKLYHRVKNDKQLYPIYLSVAEEWVAFLGREMEKCLKSNSKLIDPRPLLAWAEKKHGLEGQAIALALLEGQNADMHKGPWGNFRRIEWSDVTELTQLFTSEGLTTKHGTFFDQRFIDYLAQNQTEVGQINWRKFEGLTCEFFQRSGFKVEIGKGRNDDSIDARIWKPNQDERTDAPLMLVQCKRQKDHVEKVVAKALYADVIHAGAESGLIVTSSSLSPGAKKLCVARSYPIKAVESDTLGKWLFEMRTPFSGIFMGE